LCCAKYLIYQNNRTYSLNQHPGTVLPLQHQIYGACMFAGKDLNLTTYDAHSFVKHFGGLYEHSPWVAELVWPEIDSTTSIPFKVLAEKLRVIVDGASDERKLALLRAHPELAGKAATEGSLTPESTDEQSRARLDLCTTEEFEKFHQLNSAYNEKFEFPFIMAVRNSTRAEILNAFEARLHNERQEEFVTALEQVHQIAHLRLDAFASTKNSEKDTGDSACE